MTEQSVAWIIFVSVMPPACLVCDGVAVFLSILFQVPVLSQVSACCFLEGYCFWPWDSLLTEVRNSTSSQIFWRHVRVKLFIDNAKEQQYDKFSVERIYRICWTASPTRANRCRHVCRSCSKHQWGPAWFHQSPWANIRQATPLQDWCQECLQNCCKGTPPLSLSLLMHLSKPSSAYGIDFQMRLLRIKGFGRLTAGFWSLSSRSFCSPFVLIM